MSRKCEVRLGKRGGSSYGKNGRGMKSLWSSNFSNPRTSRDWRLDRRGFEVSVLTGYLVVKYIDKSNTDISHLIIDCFNRVKSSQKLYFK